MSDLVPSDRSPPHEPLPRQPPRGFKLKFQISGFWPRSRSLPRRKSLLRLLLVILGILLPLMARVLDWI